MLLDILQFAAVQGIPLWVPLAAGLAYCALSRRVSPAAGLPLLRRQAALGHQLPRISIPGDRRPVRFRGQRDRSRPGGGRFQQEISVAVSRGTGPRMDRHPSQPYPEGTGLPVLCREAGLRHHLARELDPELNGGTTAGEVVAGSNRRLTWRCPVNPEHIWEATPKHRTSGVSPTGCPYCSGLRVLPRAAWPGSGPTSQSNGTWQETGAGVPTRWPPAPTTGLSGFARWFTAGGPGSITVLGTESAAGMPSAIWPPSLHRRSSWPSSWHGSSRSTWRTSPSKAPWQGPQRGHQDSL